MLFTLITYSTEVCIRCLLHIYLITSICLGECGACALGKDTFLTSWLCRKEVDEKCHEGGDNRDNGVNQS